MKKNTFHAAYALWKQATSLVMLLLFGVCLAGQSTDFCGTYAAQAPSGTNPDSLVYDRFGNVFDLADLAVPVPPAPLGGTAAASICNSGYFNLTFYGTAPNYLPPNWQETVCKVFGDISNVVQHRQGQTACSVIPPEMVNLQVIWLNFGNPDPALVQQLKIKTPLPSEGAGIGSAFYDYSLDGCSEMVLELPFIKINGGSLYPSFDGRILLNTQLPNTTSCTPVTWNADANATNFPCQIDLYTVVLHELMHVLGFASGIGSGWESTLWDHSLRVVDQYPGGGNPRRVITTTSSTGNTLNCDINCWKINETITNIGGIALNPCQFSNPDLVVGDAGLAPVGGYNGGSIANTLSHLNPNCNQPPTLHDYVMAPGLATNQHKRKLTDPELNILCQLGYAVTSPTATCSGCYAIGQYDDMQDIDESCCAKVYYSCYGGSIHISQQDLLCNDIANSDVEVINVWAKGKVITKSGDGWDIALLPSEYGLYTFNLFYTIRGCEDECRMNNSFAFIMWIIDDCQPCVPSNPCENLLCVSDFENFSPDNTPIHQHNVWFGHPFYFEGYDYVGTPDIINAGNGNNYLNLSTAVKDIGWSGKESVTLELKNCINSGCNLNLELDVSWVTWQPGSVSLGIWGSDSRPCSVLGNPIVSIPNSCGTPTTCSPGDVFEPICITSIPITNLGSTGIPNLQPAFPSGPFIWHNVTNQDICFLTLVPSGPDRISIGIDNISATEICRPTFTVTPTVPATVCAGKPFNLSYAICLTDISGGTTTQVTPKIDLPPDWQLVGGGLAPFTLTEGQCTTLTLQVLVPANATIGSMPPIKLSATAGTCGEGQFSNTVNPKVTDCNPPFPCPCTNADPLNIDAGPVSSNPSPNPPLPGVSISTTAIPSRTVNAYFSPNTLFNTCLAIKGYLVIDGNYDLAIVGGEIRMQPGAKIIVKSGSRLTISYVNANGGMHGCETMWRSIEVEPGGFLRVGYSTVQDAEFAIDARSVGSPGTSVSAFWTDFNRNHVGIRVNNNMFGTLTQSFPFSDNKFRATSGLLPKFSSDVTNWHAQNPFAGLFLRNTNFTVGIKSNSATVNLFDHLRNGIVADRTSLYVYNAKFTNSQGFMGFDDDPTVTTSQGLGIFAVDCQQNFEVYKTRFEEGSRGIHSDHSSLNIQKSVLQNQVVSIHARNLGGQRIKIRDNDFYYRSRAIELQGVEGALKINVDRNDPMTLVPSGNLTLVNNCAIGASGPKTALADASIALNKINIPGSGLGISISGAGNWTIQENHVTYSGAQGSSEGTLSGIDLGDSDGNYLYHNTVTGDNASADLRAFNFWGSAGNILCCNTTGGLGTGFSFTSTCADTRLRHSEIGSHQLGLNIEMGYIGKQPHAGNRWNGGYPDQWAQHLGEFSDVKDSEFKLESTQPLMPPPLWPQNPNSPAAPGQWFVEWPGNSASCLGDASPTSGGQCPVPPLPPTPPGGIRDFTDIEKRTAAYGYSTSPYGDMLQFESGRNLYRTLKDNNDLLGTDTAVDQFYTAAGSGTIGRLYDLDQQIAAMWQVAAADLAQINVYQQQVDQLAQAMNQADSLLQYAHTAADTLTLQNQKQAAVSAMQSPLQNWQALMANIQSAQRSWVPGIAALNNSITATDVLTANRKTVNTIYLQTIAVGNYVLSTAQQNSLWSVAAQCAKAGGNAVLQARAMYAQLVDQTLFDEAAACSPQRSAARSTTPPKTSLYKAQLVPNPAQDRFAVQVNGAVPGAEVRVKISALNGRVVKEATVQNGNVLAYSFQLGMYICQVFIGDELADTLKLIIIP